MTAALTPDDAAQRKPVAVDALEALLGDKPPFIAIDDLRAGYGHIEILHGVNLRLHRGGSLCLIGPNGAGKSTVLHAVYGLARRIGGTIQIGGREISALPPGEKLRRAKIAYILQDSSIFPQMTVEENLLMGGYILDDAAKAREAAENIFAKYPRLSARRRESAGALSGGERRLLEISRALITDPQVLLVDEPSIGLEPRYIELVFEILGDLQQNDGKTILMVEQNAKKGLAFADIGYVLAAGRLILADAGSALLENPEVGRLFLGG
jgi:branched-chain amino acid transport system ATP-binding protein